MSLVVGNRISDLNALVPMITLVLPTYGSFMVITVRTFMMLKKCTTVWGSQCRVAPKEGSRYTGKSKTDEGTGTGVF